MSAKMAFEANISISPQEFPDLRGTMSREIIGDDMNFLGRGLASNDLLEKSHELRAGMAGRASAEHFTTLGVERRKERKLSICQRKTAAWCLPAFCAIWRMKQWLPAAGGDPMSQALPTVQRIFPLLREPHREQRLSLVYRLVRCLAGREMDLYGYRAL
jgi:hypothetical protein